MSKIKYGPYACFSDSTTQAVANAANVQAITFNTDETKYRITHSTSVNPSRIYIDIAGTYYIFLSAVVDTTSGTNKRIHMFMNVEGTPVARSNTILNIATSSMEQVISVAFYYTFTAGQYFEIMMWGTDTTVEILATGAQANPTRPACPSIILTVHKVSS